MEQEIYAFTKEKDPKISQTDTTQHPKPQLNNMKKQKQFQKKQQHRTTEKIKAQKKVESATT